MKMTAKEAVQLLKTRLKPYNQIVPQMSQSRFSITMRNIELGFSKPKTVTEFLTNFGFTGTFDSFELDINNWFLKAK